MNPIRVLAASLMLNALLLGTLIWKVRSQQSPRSTPPPTVAYGVGVESALETESTPVLDETETTGPFHWNQLDTTDGFAYRDGLLRIGCPPATVRDILKPRVNRHYGERIRSLIRPYSEQFWDRLRPPFERVLKDLEVETDALEEEETNLLSRLFAGFPAGNGPSNDPSAWEDYELDFLPEDIRGKVSERFEADQGRREKVAQTQFQNPAEREEALRALKVQLDAELGEILSDEERAELTQRRSNHAQIRFVEGVDLSPSELREVVRISDALESDGRVGYGNGSGPQRKALEQLLGPDRAAALERARDPQFQPLLTLARRLGGTPDQAVALWNAQNTAAEQARSITRAEGLTEADRQAALEILQAGLRQRVGSILGGERGIDTWERSMKGWREQTYQIPEFDPVDALDTP